MVDTTKESTCWPVNSNDEIVVVDGDGSRGMRVETVNGVTPSSASNLYDLLSALM